jgi:glutathione peroxidase
MPMKRPRTLRFLAAPALLAASAAVAAANCPALLDHRVKTLKGQGADLCDYSGKVVLVVNTASFCGYTPQYKGLESLYQKYRAQGLVVLGFPSNDFGAQEPGTNEQVADFCERTYAVKFPMFDKSVVKGAGAGPVYQGLIAASGEAPKWNFHKYLIGRDGKLLESFASKVAPEDPKLVSAVERAIQAR